DAEDSTGVPRHRVAFCKTSRGTRRIHQSRPGTRAGTPHVLAPRGANVRKPRHGERSLQVPGSLRRQVRPATASRRQRCPDEREVSVMLTFGATKPETEFQLFTEHPVALDSRDHIVPGGTMMDDTRGKPFVAMCAKLFIEKYNRPYAFLDLGCSSGGLVEETL